MGTSVCTLMREFLLSLSSSNDSESLSRRPGAVWISLGLSGVRDCNASSFEEFELPGGGSFVL